MKSKDSTPNSSLLTPDSTPEAALAGLGVRVRGFVASVAGLCKGCPRSGAACGGCVARGAAALLRDIDGARGGLEAGWDDERERRGKGRRAAFDRARGEVVAALEGAGRPLYRSEMGVRAVDAVGLSSVLRRLLGDGVIRRVGTGMRYLRYELAEGVGER